MHLNKSGNAPHRVEVKVDMESGEIISVKFSEY